MTTSTAPQTLGGCVVCGKASSTRCSKCNKAGIDWMFFCSQEHQTLVSNVECVSHDLGLTSEVTRFGPLTNEFAARTPSDGRLSIRMKSPIYSDSRRSPSTLRPMWIRTIAQGIRSSTAKSERRTFRILQKLRHIML